MQPTDNLSVTRRAMDVEDYIDILRRHKSWILGPTFLGLVAAVVVAFLWPDTYVSTAIIRVVPPSVPEKYVPTNVNQELSQRINSMAQIILSRSTLTNIIQSYGLYPREQKRLPMDDIVEQMKKDGIRISPVYSATGGGSRSNVSAFQVAFAYENRAMAHRVTQELVTKFIDENIRQRSNAAVQTTEFLQEQLDSAKRDLDTIEKKLTDFRINNFGRLPDQMQTNLQQLDSMQKRMDTLNNAVSRINQEKQLLEGQKKILKDQLAALSNPASVSLTPPKSEAMVQVDREIEATEMALASAKERYKEAHPDVQRIQQQLSVLRRKKIQVTADDKAKLADAKPIDLPAPLQREIRDTQANIQRIDTLLHTKDEDLDHTHAEITTLDKNIRTFNTKLESSPVGEQEYTSLMRERSLAMQQYQDFSSKRSQSATATDLENRKQGEMLEILDQPSLPQTPSEPNRYVIVLGGVAIGVVLGVFMAGVREMKDTSLKNLKDVRAYTQLAVLGSIPLLENDLVMRRRRRLAWLAWSTAFLLGIMVMSGSIYYYYVSNA
jgi:polysaccharide chain length determinant protein (PEP-CTERM system associated)